MRKTKVTYILIAGMLLGIISIFLSLALCIWSYSIDSLKFGLKISATSGLIFLFVLVINQFIKDNELV